MPEQKIWQVAIVGAGIGAEHAAAYRQLPSQFNVHTVCDLDKSRAQLVLDTLPGTHYSNNFNQLIADESIDIIDICLPPHLHYDFCVAALNAGKHVICEKPLVTSLAKLDCLQTVLAQSGTRLFPVFQYRYGPAATQLRALIDAGFAGTPLVASLETHWNRDAAYYAPEWRGTWKGECGGAILTHAIHSHDWLSYILGPVKSVYARLATRVNGIEVEDCAALSIEMQCGALATSSVTLGAASDTSRLRFCFEWLTAESGADPYSPASGDWTFTARDQSMQAGIDSVVNSVGDVVGGFEGLFNSIAILLDGGPSNATDIDDARNSLEFVTAVYRAAQTRMPVELPVMPTASDYGSWIPTGMSD